MFESYKAGKGNIKWIMPNKKKLYLFLMDGSFKQSDINKYKKYCSAFFPGTEVDVLRRTDFLTKAKIENREAYHEFGDGYQYRTCG